MQEDCCITREIQWKKVAPFEGNLARALLENFIHKWSSRAFPLFEGGLLNNSWTRIAFLLKSGLINKFSMVSPRSFKKNCSLKNILLQLSCRKVAVSQLEDKILPVWQICKMQRNCAASLSARQSNQLHEDWACKVQNPTIRKNNKTKTVRPFERQAKRHASVSEL